MRDGILDIIWNIWMEHKRQKIINEYLRKQALQQNKPAMITIGSAPEGIIGRRLLPFYCPRCTGQLHYDFIFPAHMDEEDMKSITDKGDYTAMAANAVRVRTICLQCSWTHDEKNPYR